MSQNLRVFAVSDIFVLFACRFCASPKFIGLCLKPVGVQTLEQDPVVIDLREQVEFAHTTAVPFQANLPDELKHSPLQT